MSRVVFHAATVAVDGRTILAPLDLVLAERRIGLLGLNGSGKSTLARLVNGLVLPSTGRVEVDGLDTRTDGKAVRRRVGFVFQAPENQIVMPLVEEDVAFGLRNLGRDRTAAREGARAALRRFGIADLAERSSHTLSGGERQLVALAAVLVMEPSLVVFDEPTTQLDLRNRNRVARAIADLPAAAIVATHDLDLVADFDRCIVLGDGRVAFDGPPAEAVAFHRTHAA